MEKEEKPNGIDGYIKAFPKGIQDILEKIRQVIKEAVPEVKETINYQIPTFGLNGKSLVHLSAWKEHIGFIPPLTGSKILKKSLQNTKLQKDQYNFQ